MAIGPFKRREGAHDGAKPGFGDTARSVGEGFVDDVPHRVRMKARLQKAYQQRNAEEGMKGEPGEWLRVR